MNCPNCGKELIEGEVCGCAVEKIETAPATEAMPVVEPTPAEEPAPVEPAPAVEPTYTQPVYEAPQEQPTYAPPVPPYYAPAPGQQTFYAPYVAPKAKTDYPEDYKIKKKYIALILAYALGVFGIHNFYLGNNSKAIAQLLVTLIGSLFFGIGICVTAVWVIVESVQILTDKIDSDSEGYKIQSFAEELAAAQKK